MTPGLETRGFCIVRRVFEPAQLVDLRAEADRLATGSGSPNLREPLPQSQVFQQVVVVLRNQGLVAPEFAPVRSILFNKTASHNWPVAWHQDLTIAVRQRRDVPGYGPWSCKAGIVSVQPPAELLATMVTARIHLDDCGADNGALHVIPGSHRNGKLPANAITAQSPAGTAVTCTAVTCTAGDVLLMKPLLLHASKRAVTPSQRRILHLEFAPRQQLHPALQWHADAPDSAAHAASHT